MTSNHPRKRARSFTDDQEAMVSQPNKRMRPPVDVQAFPLAEQEILQRAAALLNRTVADLVQTPGDSSQAYATPASQSYSVPDFQEQTPATPYPGTTPAWLPAAQYQQQNQFQPSSYVQQAEQMTFGSAPHQSERFDSEVWHNMQTLSTPGPQTSFSPQDEFLQPAQQFHRNNSRDHGRVFEMGSAGYAHEEALPVTSQNSQADHHGGNEIEVIGTDTSSEMSENESEGLDTQPWENVQIDAVKQLISSENDPDSDYLWLDDSEVPPAEDLQNASQSVSIGTLLGGNQGMIEQESRQHKTRKPFQDPALRDETSITRKLKACVRCRMQKIRCVIDPNDPTGVCKTCQDVSKQRIYTLPCARYKITECTLYRTGKAPGLEFTFRWPVMKLKDITKWADNRVRTIQVMSDVCPVPLELHVRKFVPLPQDSHKRGWMDGKTKKFKQTTPFAIVNMNSAMKEMMTYIDSNVLGCMKYFLRRADPLIRETYDFAMQHCERHRNDEEGLLMGNFLRLWFAVRRTQTMEHISGNDTLDMEPEKIDKSYPLFGKVPLPPVMVQQLDMILTLGILQPLRKKVLAQFQEIIMSTKPTSWLTAYLITFMSLHSCATITNENYKNARKQGLRRRYSMPTFVTERHHAANVFLSHYHYRTQPCNPFKLDWKRRQATPFADMAPSEMQFLWRTKDLVEKRRDRFQKAKENNLYEDEVYFISQMFEDDWQPRESIIDFDDGTINNVPLRQYG